MGNPRPKLRHSVGTGKQLRQADLCCFCRHKAYPCLLLRNGKYLLVVSGRWDLSSHGPGLHTKSISHSLSCHVLAFSALPSPSTRILLAGSVRTESTWCIYHFCHSHCPPTTAPGEILPPTRDVLNLSCWWLLITLVLVLCRAVEGLKGWLNDGKYKKLCCMRKSSERAAGHTKEWSSDTAGQGTCS